MGLLRFPKVSRKLQRTLKNLRVSVLCFLLTFLMLRNSIGAGKFGTPAQDFEEIRLHLHNVALHRRQLRALAEVVREENSSFELLKRSKPGNVALLAGSEDENGGSISAARMGNNSGNAVPTAQDSRYESKQDRKDIASIKGMRWKAASLAVDLRHRSLPLFKASIDASVSRPNVGKSVESMAFSQGKAMSKPVQFSVPESSRVVVVAADAQALKCSMFAAKHIRLGSHRSIWEYSRRQGFEISAVPGGQTSRNKGLQSKISLLKSVMQENARFEWIWWVPSGALLVTDITSALPLHSYLDFNVVLLGAVGASYPQENLMISLETDSFLIRNSQWSFETVQDSLELSIAGRLDASTLAIKTIVSKPEVALQNFIPNQARNIPTKKVYVEDSVVLREDLVTNIEHISSNLIAGSEDNRLPFITHVLGCNSCQEGWEIVVAKCLNPMEELLLLSSKQAKLQGRGLDSGNHGVM